MGDGKNYREPRRRGFDDDFQPPYHSAPRQSGYAAPGVAPRPAARPSANPEPTGPEVGATVKWYKADKGFGFVELESGGDAFLHASVLQAAGHDDVPAGATLRVQVGSGQKGPQVTRVLDVDASAPAPARTTAPRPGAAPRGPRHDESSARTVHATVKWFNDTKGFGFAADGTGGKDIFVHVSVLQKAGLTHLDEGQPVTLRVVDTPKGREAISIGD